MIEAQKGARSARNRRREHGKPRRAEGERDRHVGERGNRDRARSEAVEAVREVHGVARADEHEEHERIVEESDVKLCVHERQPDRRRNAEFMLCEKNDDDGDDDLPQELLPRLEAEVALLHDLDVVIEEAEREVPEHHEEREPYARRQGRGGKRRERDGGDDHDAAHRRRAALRLMALRPFLAYALPELQLVQLGNHEGAGREHEDGGERRRSCKRKRRRIHIHHLPASSAFFNRGMISSIFMPREPLKSTASPGCRISLSLAAAASCDAMRSTSGTPPAFAASAMKRLSSPRERTAAKPRCAASSPTLAWPLFDALPSSSMSPRTAIFLPANISASVFKDARVDAGLAL